MGNICPAPWELRIAGAEINAAVCAQSPRNCACLGMVSPGVPPRSRRILRLIALERIVRGALLLAAAVYLLFHLNSDFGRLGERVMRAIELDPRRPFLHRVVVYLHHLHASEVRVAALFALGYGLLELVEGTGLWLDQLWAEYLTVIATSLLIPLELYELVRHPTALKAGGLAVNVLIVAYLACLLRRRLNR
jgi:uncharacterized membrane protein (DUF2068 family)